MNINEQNAKFDALDGLTDGQREYLIQQNRVAGTEVRFDQETALQAVGMRAFDSDFTATGDKRLRFGGNLITSRPMQDASGNPDFTEAQKIADARGWGETIGGAVCAIKPFDDKEGGGLSPSLN